MADTEPWGQLVSLTDFETPPILLTENIFEIGRAADCSLSFTNNKLLSGHHCHIHRDGEGNVTLVDTSTNGTLLNMAVKITKGKSEPLKHGDEFYVVYKKNEEEHNIGFVFQDMEELAKEDSSDHDETDATLEDPGCNYVSPVKETLHVKRKSEEESDVDATTAKKLKPDCVTGKDGTVSTGGGAEKLKPDVSRGVGGDRVSYNKCCHGDSPGDLEHSSGVNNLNSKHFVQPDSVIVSNKEASRKETDNQSDEVKAGTRVSVKPNAANIEPESKSKISEIGEQGCHSEQQKTDTKIPVDSTVVTASDAVNATTAVVAAGTATAATTAAGTAAAPAISAATSTTGAAAAKDDIEETLQCLICHDIMHDCISLQPCLHCFCSGCYSSWMKESDKCPSCRQKVKKINKNHMVNNLIEAYLKTNPEKKRPDDDIQELDAKNTITKDMLYQYPQENDSSSDYSTDDDEEEGLGMRGGGNLGGVGGAIGLGGVRFHYVPPQPLPAPPQPVLYGFGTPVFGVNRAFKTVCRQCPEYKDPAPNTGVAGGIAQVFNAVKNLITGDGNQTATKTDGEPANTDTGSLDYNAATQEAGPSGLPVGDPGPSTSGDGNKGKPTPLLKDEKVMPDAPPHKCGPNQNHVLCQCCLQPFPDFRVNPHPTDDRPQQCGLCYRAYCHAYWGCRKADCLGCLAKFKEMNFGRKALVGLILENQYESEIFRDYIDSKGMSVKDVLQICCDNLAAGRFNVQAQVTHRFSINTPVCYACGLTSFRQMALQYRKTLKKEDFPENVQNRPDCYWGSKCRTQRNKPQHAKKFNHICDQTRQT